MSEIPYMKVSMKKFTAPLSLLALAVGLLSLAGLTVLSGCNNESSTTETEPLQGFFAGVAVEELDIPVGVPQGGYGARYAKIPLLSLILGGGGIRLPDDRESP